MYVILTLLKAIIIISGLGFSIYYFTLYREGKSSLKKAAWIFVSTWLLIIIITVIEFIIVFHK